MNQTGLSRSDANGSPLVELRSTSLPKDDQDFGGDLLTEIGDSFIKIVSLPTLPWALTKGCMKFSLARVQGRMYKPHLSVSIEPVEPGEELEVLYELDAKRAVEIRNVSVALVSSWTMDYVGPLEHAEWHYRSLVWAKCEAKDLHKVGRVPAGARWGRTFRIRCPTGAHSTYSDTVGDWWRRSLKWCLVIDLQTTRWWLNRSEAYALTVVGGPKPPQRHWNELESRHYPYCQAGPKELDWADWPPNSDTYR